MADAMTDPSAQDALRRPGWGDFADGSEIQRTMLELLGDARLAEMQGAQAEAQRFTRYSDFVGELGAEIKRLREAAALAGPSENQAERINAFRREVLDKLMVVEAGVESSPLRRAIVRQQCVDFLTDLYRAALAGPPQEPEVSICERRSPDGDGQTRAEALIQGTSSKPHPVGEGPATEPAQRESAGVVTASQGDRRLHGSSERKSAVGSEPADALILQQAGAAPSSQWQHPALSLVNSTRDQELFQQAADALACPTGACGDRECLKKKLAVYETPSALNIGGTP